jgi:Tfp pilus assembly protein PilF
MSRTLNLIDSLRARGCQLFHRGRSYEAAQVWGRLIRLGDLPEAAAEEAHAQLAEIELDRGQCEKGRRHLALALLHNPDNANYHFWMASALNDPEEGDLERAAEHYRKTLELEPAHPFCLAEYGLLCLRLGNADEGLEALAKAIELLPNDPEILEMHVDGLCQAGKRQEARQALLAARFRNAGDARFEKLWNDFQFRLLREEQEAARAQRETEADGRMILPFKRPRTAPRNYRHDSAARLKPPHLPRVFQIPDRRHA